MNLELQTTSYLKISKEVIQRRYDKQLKELKKTEKEIKKIQKVLNTRKRDIK